MPSPRKFVRPTLGIIGLAALIVWSGGCLEHKLPPSQLTKAPGLPIPANALTITLVATNIAPAIDIIGTVASENRINISSRILAYIKQIFVSAGDNVTKGQLLVLLDDRELKEQLAFAEARLRQADTEYQRARQLIAAAATSEQQLTTAKANYETALAQVEQIKVTLSYTEITSPIDGKVTDRHIEPGDLSSPGSVLLAVYDPKKIRLEAPVPLRLVDLISLGQTVTIDLERPSRSFQAKVSEIVAEVDQYSRTQLVKAQIDPGGYTDILPGTFGRLWIHDHPQPTLLAPTSSVYRIGQMELVQIANNGRAVSRLVKTGQTYPQGREILAGLEPGDTILVQPIR